MTKIKNFTDLNAWKESYKLTLLVYKATANFPSKEIFGLTSQIRRASVSISSNIAEGFSRRSRKEKLQFYSMAMGSLTELENQILIAFGVGYLKSDERNMMLSQTIIVQKLIGGLIKGVNKLGKS